MVPFLPCCWKGGCSSFVIALGPLLCCACARDGSMVHHSICLVLDRVKKEQNPEFLNTCSWAELDTNWDCPFAYLSLRFLIWKRKNWSSFQLFTFQKWASQISCYWNRFIFPIPPHPPTHKSITELLNLQFERNRHSYGVELKSSHTQIPLKASLNWAVSLRTTQPICSHGWLVQMVPRLSR